MNRYSSTNRSGKIECDVLLTNRCNLACKHCLYIERNPEKKDLSSDNLERLLSQLEGSGAEIHLLGGEPLCRADICDIVDSITKKGLVAKILTNGYALTEQLMRSLVDSGLQEIGFSVDGTEKIHNLNRGNLQSFEKVINAIEIAKSFGFSPKVSCAVHKGNASSICSMLHLLDERKVKRILLEHVLPIGHGQQLIGQNLNPLEWTELISDIRNYKIEKALSINIAIQEVYSPKESDDFACVCSSGKVPIIDEWGNCYPCIILFAADAKIGSLSDESINAMMRKSNIENYLSELINFDYYAHGNMIIKCPAIRLLLKTRALDLDNIRDYKYSMGCFHRVIVL